jgi:CDP-diglyceride synthetase
MNYSINLKRGESIIYIVLWMIILLMPVFFSNTNSGMDWSRVRLEWFRLLPFFLVFLVHNYLLFPRFFIAEKSFFYYLLTLLLVLLAGIFADYIGTILGIRPEEAFHPFPN